MNILKHNRKRALVWVFLFAFTLVPNPYTLSPAFSGGPGSASVQILKTDMSPRAMGMGGSFVAVADDIYATNYNPAGIGQLYIPEASAMYLSGFEDSKLQYLAFGMPLPMTGLAGLDKPGLAFSALFSQNGDFTYRLINPNGTVSSSNMDAETTRVFALTYGEKVYSGEMNLEGYKATFEQYLGLSAKYIGSELLGKYSASAFAADAGWLVREPNLGLTFGAALSNYGTGIKYRTKTEALPSILRLGLSYQRPTILDQSVLLSLESDSHMNESLKSLRAGLEYHFEKYFNFRLGYKTMEDNSGMTMGLGIRHEGFALDFAMSLANEVFNTSQVSFSYKFTNWRPVEYKKSTQYRDQEEVRPQPRKAVKPAKKVPAKPRKSDNIPANKDSDFFMLY
ncbi:MAG: PorV/PorQ family protein [Elusimicrobiota bacterium]